MIVLQSKETQCPHSSIMVFSHVDAYNIPLEQKVDALFEQKENGFFIELGANDGLTQSNTAFLAKTRGWKGILIEPSKKAFDQCVQNRPESLCFHAACVSSDFSGSFVLGDFTDGSLMASVNGGRLHRGLQEQVAATTIERILDDNLQSSTIDFLSLDTEGYELPILEGLNLKKYRPRYMLIEIYEKDYEKITNFLTSNGYQMHSNFSGYTKELCPHWDGTHNDYLFYDTK